MSDRNDAGGAPGLFSLTQIRHLMRTEFGRAKRYEYPVGCLMVELDGLATFRDRFGFDAKEGLFEDLVALLLAQTRSCDYLGRMMDDRLLLILPHTDGPGIEALTTRLQEAVPAMPPQAGAEDFALRLNAGSSLFADGEPMFFDALLDQAEAALDRAGGGAHVRHGT